MQLVRAQRPVPMPNGSGRLTFRRLRSPTPVPMLGRRGGWSNYLARLAWLFG